MTDPKNIDEAILALQADLPVLTKDKKGQVGNQKTKYADLVQANEQILTRLNTLGATWVCTPDLLLPDYRFVLRYELRHVASGTVKTGMFPIKGDSPMQQGSAITYARRYALLAVTGVVAEDEDDDGNAAAGQRYAQRAGQGRARQAPPEGRTVQRQQRTGRPALPGEDPDGPVAPEQHRHMHALWNELGFGGDENRGTRLARTANLLGLPDLNSSADLTRAQADQVIAALKARKEKLAAAQGGAK